MYRKWHVIIFAGMSMAQAHRHHLMKMDLSDDLLGQPNHALNPSPRSIEHMRDMWLKKEHGLNSPSILNQ